MGQVDGHVDAGLLLVPQPQLQLLLLPRHLIEPTLVHDVDDKAGESAEGGDSIVSFNYLVIFLF